MKPLLLASSSIYRKALLSRLQLPFTTYSPDIDETPLPNESCEILVQRLSIEKAQVAANLHPNTVCIGSDEVAVLNGKILGKPSNHENAIIQLSSMSGQKVYFYTGLCVAITGTESYQECQLAITAVKFRPLTDSMIENYLQKEKPYGSAGSFKSETLGSALIEKFEGDDPTAMIGLPLILLCDMLNRAGVEVI